MDRSIGNRIIVGVIIMAVLAIATGAVAAIMITGMGMAQSTGHSAVTHVLADGTDGPPWG